MKSNEIVKIPNLKSQVLSPQENNRNNDGDNSNSID